LGHPLFGRADDDVRNGVVKTKITPAQRQQLIEAPAGVPQRIDQRVLRPVREVVQLAGDFGPQQVAGQLGVGRGHGPQRQRPAIVGLRGGQPDRPVNGR